MLKLLNKLTNAVSVAIAYAAIATIVAQLLLVGHLARQGMLTPAKLRSYAAILYGVDLSTLPPPASVAVNSEPSAASTGPPATMELRQSAITQGAAGIHTRAQELKRNRERFESIKSSYDQLLAKLETEASARAVAEVQRTMEVVQAKQGKELLLRILRAAPREGVADPLQSVVGIVRQLPSDRVKKVFAEFKTDDERKQLHRILVEMGELE